jgi:hypothetical protein
MYREVTMIEIREVLRLRGEGLPKKRIAAQLGLDPKTVRRYLTAAQDAGLPRDPELRAQERHLLAFEQPGDTPKPLVHDVTLLPRHALALGGKVSPMCPEYGVTYVARRTNQVPSGPN